MQVTGLGPAGTASPLRWKLRAFLDRKCERQEMVVYGVDMYGVERFLGIEGGRTDIFIVRQESQLLTEVAGYLYFSENTSSLRTLQRIGPMHDFRSKYLPQPEGRHR